ncbi:Hypothetical Protein FCC1311_100392 [Hondaea fermentalgiana]|uniref:Uncharacterized protein n=1 Tax=Hondaea fermentalgiana TaxID=2315210 RepID=A0A2R5GSG1_9STRA|nr:Hypothetical Protein FCC1311_100392 [Hondaea fermentalgiana]|eukprot:GBG33816.1 Hypothetical Protein FCC1311_100392 [Hondaea fermentalgiana]
MIITDYGVERGVDTAEKQKKMVMTLSKVAIGMIAIDFAINSISTAVSSSDAMSDDATGFSGMAVGMALAIDAVISALVMLIPGCAIGGVKQQNPALLCTACVFSCICAGFALLTMLGALLVLFGAGTIEIAGVPQDADLVGYNILVMFSALIAFIIWSILAYASSRLHSTMQVAVVVVGSPQPVTVPVAVQIAPDAEYVKQAPV